MDEMKCPWCHFRVECNTTGEAVIVECSHCYRPFPMSAKDVDSLPRCSQCGNACAAYYDVENKRCFNCAMPGP